jgi:hypothetical protein
VAVYWSRWNLWAADRRVVEVMPRPRSRGPPGFLAFLRLGACCAGRRQLRAQRAPRVGHKGRPGRCAPCPGCATSVAFGRPSVRSDGSVPASRRRHSTSARSTWPNSAGCARVSAGSGCSTTSSLGSSPRGRGAPQARLPEAGGRLGPPAAGPHGRSSRWR